MPELIELSWQTQVVLVGGYLGYTIAYSGKRRHHTVLDSAAMVLCFGSSVLLSLAVLQPILLETGVMEYAAQISALLGVVASILMAALWRSFLAGWARRAISLISNSEEDGLPSAWNTLIQTEKLGYSQINVLLTDGRTLESYPLEPFNSLPNGPCVLGEDGAVALYVTHITTGEERRETKNLNTGDGARMTYIPANQIKEIDLRRHKLKSR